MKDICYPKIYIIEKGKNNMKEKLEVVTEIGTFGSLNIPDPTTQAISESMEDDEELDMTKLANKILESE